MELNVGVFLHGHLKGVGRLGQKHVATFLVLGKVQSLAHFEISQLGFVVAGNPCGLIERNRLVTA